VFGRHRKQLVYPLIQRCVVSDKRKQSGADRQAAGQRRRMGQPPRFSDVCVAQCQRLVRNGGWASLLASATFALLSASAWSGKPRQKRTIPKFTCELGWGWIPT
jgi:hypothetical protein